jgi:hypothetical protein
MTFEEIQRTIEQMLSIQRELQEGQLKLYEQQQRQTRILDQLIGYSISAESGRLDLEDKMTLLENRVKRLEGRAG